MALYILTAIVVISVFYLARKFLRSQENETKLKTIQQKWDYDWLVRFINGNKIELPAMIVDETILLQNIDHVIISAAGSGKTVRVATKSVRSLDILKRILERGNQIGVNGVLKGLMCYSVKEAKFLSEHGFDNFFIPYPTFQRADIEMAVAMTMEKKTIYLTVDSISGVRKLDEIVSFIFQQLPAKERNNVLRLKVSVDLDMSFYWTFVILGAHRSRIATVSQFTAVSDAIVKSEHLQLRGIMGYEAHVAGLPDKKPSIGFLPSLVVRYLKREFYKQCVRRRNEVRSYCKRNYIKLDFFNGSGSGNFRQALTDHSLSEVTVGSAFLQGQIFDNFDANQCLPAMCFALQITRVQGDYITCQSGGFIASGDIGIDKTPTPFQNPTTLTPLSGEGYGEVQTPLTIQNAGVYDLGNPVFFRPAKSGEIAERFDHYVIKEGYKIVETVKTYRGMGKTFF